jgi:polygalacturonase
LQRVLAEKAGAATVQRAAPAGDLQRYVAKELVGRSNVPLHVSSAETIDGLGPEIIVPH